MGQGGSKGGSHHHHQHNPEAEISDHDRAVLDLKHARDTLKQQQKKLEGSMARETEVARQLLRKGNKQGALVVVKKKKLQQTLLDKTLVQLDNVQQLLEQIDFAKVNAQVFESLKAGKNALEQLNAVMSVEDVEKLLEENADQMAVAEEIDQAVRRHMGGDLTKEQEEEIEQEYQQLLQGEAADVDLPNVPLKDPHKPQQDKVVPQQQKKQPVLG